MQAGGSLRFHGFSGHSLSGRLPPGIPVATVGLDGSLNAAILATQILASGDTGIQQKVIEYKKN